MRSPLGAGLKWQIPTDAVGLLQEVEKLYNLKVVRYKPAGSLFLLDTSSKMAAGRECEGRQVLKRSRLSCWELEFIQESLLFLQEGGFSAVAVPLPTTEGKGFFLWQNYFYILYDWVSGRYCDYLKEEDAIAVARAIARFHRCWRGRWPARVPDSRWFLGHWLEHFSYQLNQIKTFARMARTRSFHYPFDRLYLQEYNRYYREAMISLEQLADSAYPNLCREKTYQAFCHHDLAYHNILMRRDGPFFLDFDYSLIDLGLHDLAGVLLRNMMLLNWDWDRARKILAAYQTVIPLDERVFPVLYALLQFPHEYWQIGLQYYSEHQPWSQTYFIQRFQRKLANPERRAEFMKHFRTRFCIG